MKRQSLLMGLLVVLLILLTGCDPIYPLGKLKIEALHALDIGDTIEIKLIYPSGGIGIIEWRNQTIEVINNPNVISVSGLQITGVEPGTATIKISATATLEKDVNDSESKEIVYSVLAKITVK
jgi:hypothetical protein